MNFTPYLYGMAEPIPVDLSKHRCAGWHCPLASNCTRHLAPGTGPNDTPWLEPDYDTRLQHCPNHLPGTPRPHVSGMVRYAAPATFDPPLDFPAAWQEVSERKHSAHYQRIIGPYRLHISHSRYSLERFARGGWVQLLSIQATGLDANAARVWKAWQEERRVNPARR